MSDPHIAISVRDLKMGFGDFIIQRDLNFDIKTGEIFVIMGDSGSGKSTLLRHLIGLQKPLFGKINYADMSFWDAPEAQRKALSKRFGVLYQSGALWSSMTLFENVAMPIREHTNYGEERIAALVQFKLALVGLAGFDAYYPSEISGGMKKRAGLARALALDPDILFFDEPSAGLDPISAKRLDDLILELRDSLGTTIVVVTHELASIYAIADSSIFVDADAKTQTALGPPAYLRDHPPTAKVGEFLRRGDGKNLNEGEAV